MFNDYKASFGWEKKVYKYTCNIHLIEMRIVWTYIWLLQTSYNTINSFSLLEPSTVYITRYITIGVLHLSVLTGSFSGARQFVSFIFWGIKTLYGDNTNSKCIFQLRLPVKNITPSLMWPLPHLIDLEYTNKYTIQNLRITYRRLKCWN